MWQRICDVVLGGVAVGLGYERADLCRQNFVIMGPGW
jgi:hypothetical protein